MTTELEKEFFRVFGIKQEYQYHIRDMGRSYVGNKQMLIDNKHLFMDKERKRSRRLYVANVSKIYPEITAEKLLEMICIYSKYTIFCLPINAGDFEEKWTCEKLKKYILKELICLYKVNIYNTNQKLQNEIQQLFKVDDTHKSTMLSIITDEEY